MTFWRLCLLAVWGLGGLSALVVALSAFSNLSRQIAALGEEAAVVQEHGGACGAVDCASFEANRDDLASLQRGARLFADYCAGCHSLAYARHQRVADDLNIPLPIYERHLLPGGSRIGDLMAVAMDAKEAEAWFGVTPPDLTMVTDVRGPEWVYTFLRSFHVDDSRPWGVDNRVFAQTAMPHVLENLQGEQRLGCVQVPAIAENGGQKRDPITSAPVYERLCDQLVLTPGSGSLSAEEFDATVYDLVNYLVYTAAPEEPLRHRIGFYVVLYLVIFSVFSYLLYREYRKDYK